MRVICAAALCLALAGCSPTTSARPAVPAASPPVRAVVEAALGEISLEVPELI